MTGRRRNYNELKILYTCQKGNAPKTNYFQNAIDVDDNKKIYICAYVIWLCC